MADWNDKFKQGLAAGQDKPEDSIVSKVKSYFGSKPDTAPVEQGIEDSAIRRRLNAKIEVKN